MVVDEIADAANDLVFHALADATRRDIVRRTMSKEHSVSGLAGFYPMSFAAVQKHVALLHAAGLVTKRRQGRQQMIAADIRAVQRARRLLDRLEGLWLDRIDRIGEVLADDKGANS